MKNLVFRNRFTLLCSVIGIYTIVLTLEGFITGREPELLEFDNSLFELNIKEIRELEGSIFN